MWFMAHQLQELLPETMEDSQVKEEFQPPSMTMDWQIALVDSTQTLC
jgi:hypothetical protein